MGMSAKYVMGALDTERQKPNVERMRILGAEVIPAHSGSKTLKDATNEAMRHWINNPIDSHYIIGSVRRSPSVPRYGRSLSVGD